ncbi:MAG: hypothetical protein AAB883_02790 [Patescibacteria group bacterium]
MTNEATKTNPAKLPPARVRECLSRDVHVILSGCIHQFKEDGEEDDTCFNVDAVIEGRRTISRSRYAEQVAPVSWSKGNPNAGSANPYARASKGNFIPSAHFSAA